MRCNQCDYPLWNLPARVCPECGTPFVPSERDYVPNSVRFCCTNCGQDYYGTDERGHLEPASFACVACGEPQTMDEMLLLPTEGVEEEQTKVFVMPWLDASYKSKRVRAWYATFALTIASPKRLAAAVPEGASSMRAWWFALVSITVFIAVGMGSYSFIRFASLSRFGFGSAMVAAGEIVLWYLFLLIGIAAAIGVWGLIAHALLKVSGATNGTIGRTYQALLYSSGSAFLVGIPIFGVLLSPIAVIWWATCAAVMLATLQGVHWFRAAVAAMVLPVLMFLLFVGWIVFGISMMMAAIGPGGFGGAATMRSVMSDTQLPTDAIVQYRAENGTDGPPHALMLVIDGQAQSSYDFIAGGTLTGESDVPLPGSIPSNAAPTLWDLGNMNEAEAGAIVEQAAAVLPADVVAHRLGDFVFTYHGTVGPLSELTSSVGPPSEPTSTVAGPPSEPTSSAGPPSAPTYDPRLWLVIYSPDPDVNFALQPNDWVAVGRADGTVIPMTVSQFQIKLIGQNALRQAAGLPPLPDPQTVTHGAPATASGR